MELNGYRQRQFRKKYTYKVGMVAVRATAAWGRFVMFIGAFLLLPIFVAASVLRKHKVIGILLTLGAAPLIPTFYA